MCSRFAERYSRKGPSSSLFQEVTVSFTHCSCWRLDIKKERKSSKIHVHAVTLMVVETSADELIPQMKLVALQNELISLI